MAFEVPPLRQRLVPLLVFGYGVAAIRLALDFWDREAAMWFGLYYAMPLAIAWVGMTRRWGIVDWKTMAVTMVATGVLVWGVWTSISYTLGQFLEWTDGRYYPGERVVAEDGSVSWVETDARGARADAPRETVAGKVGSGLLHGLLSSLAGSAWCIVFGTVFVWVYRPPAKR